MRSAPFLKEKPHKQVVVPLLVATLNRGPPLMWPQIFGATTMMHLLLSLTEGHLSNVVTISWQIRWPYYS